MATQVPGCCDTKWELLFKIVLQFQSMVADQSLVTPPTATDSFADLWRKILLTLPLI